MKKKINFNIIIHKLTKRAYPYYNEPENKKF